MVVFSLNSLLNDCIVHAFPFSYLWSDEYCVKLETEVVVEHLPSMYRVLDFILSTEKISRKETGEGGKNV